MKILKAKQVREADEFTIKNEPILSINLMERAAKACTKKIIKLYGKKHDFIIFAGPGNNGGDGLVIARLLASKKYNVSVFVVKFTSNFSDDFVVNYKRLEKQGIVKIEELSSADNFPEIQKNNIIIDAIFGSGLTRVVKGFPGEIIKLINNFQVEIIAVDIPSGLFGEENFAGEQNIIKATHTLTFEYPFLSFFYAENENYTGEFHIIPIGIHREYTNSAETDFFLLEKKDIFNKIKKRKKFSHKGNYGHALIFAGSYGKAGACILSVKAAHRTGAGLISAAVPICNYQILQITSPETMLCIDNSEKYLSEIPDLEKYNALAIGPGIGFKKQTKQLLKKLIEISKVPIVFDADAITILSQNKNWLKLIPENSIFTPHPKEFERLIGNSKNNRKRTSMQIEFAKKYKCYVILKGAFSSIATPSGKCFLNPTGNSGMATAGSGDVLTGIIVSLLAQNYNSEEASVIGTYIHGLAGDFAEKQKGKNALISSDIINCISF